MRLPLVIAAALALGAATQAAAQPVTVPLDGETTIGRVGVACTGIGETKNQPKWLAYPVRVEFATADRAYLAGETLTLSGPGGHALLSVNCEGPWVLLRLPDARTYTVTAQLTDQPAAPRSTPVKTPKHGQARFVITFPDAH